MKVTKHTYLIFCLFLTSTLFAQVNIYPVVYGEYVLSKNIVPKSYEPLFEVTDLTKSQVISGWDTLANSWQMAIIINALHSANCSRTLSKNVDIIGLISDKDSFTYTNNRLTSRTNNGATALAQYRYTGTRTVPDSIIFEDRTNNQTSLYLYTYDANNLPSSVLVQSKVGNTYRDSLRAIYRHNAAGQLTFFKADYKDVGTWYPWEQDSMAYNTANKIVKTNTIYQADTLEDTYFYDLTNRMTRAEFRERINGQLVMTSRAAVPANRYHYSGAPTEIIYEELNGVTWDSIFRLSFAYNGAFSITNYTIQEYTGRGFQNALQQLNTYCGQRVSTDDKHFKEKALTLFPNPVSEQLSLDFAIEDANMTIQIFDLMGKMVVNEKNVQPQTTVSVAHLINGFYTVRVQSGDMWAVRQFVKM